VVQIAPLAPLNLELSGANAPLAPLNTKLSGANTGRYPFAPLNLELSGAPQVVQVHHNHRGKDWERQ
jgi:hypothetical protein